MASISKNKRGNAITDTITLVVVLFIVALVWFIAYYSLSEVNTRFQADPNMGNYSRARIGDLTNRMDTTFDSAFIMIFFLIWFMVIIASFTVRTHPVFFGISILLFIFITIIGAIFSNTYQDLKDDPRFATYANDFPFTDFIFNHYVSIMVLTGASVLLVLYGKIRSDF